MRSDYKFIRHGRRISAYARVVLESTPAAESAVVWAPELSGYRKIYGVQVEEGIRAALTAAGGAWLVTVELIHDAPADTMPDHVRCAAALAAWTSFGHSDSEVLVEERGETWSVSFPDSSE